MSETDPDVDVQREDNLVRLRIGNVSIVLEPSGAQELFERGLDIVAEIIGQVC